MILDIPTELIEDIPFTGGQRKGTPFIKGPIPLWWLGVLHQECKPSALKLALLLFYRHGLGDSGRPISKRQMETFGINRWRKTEALEEMSQARLITLVERGRRLIPQLDLESRNPDKGSL
jgi:hypothetical protein